jgi:hypothetical protein
MMSFSKLPLATDLRVMRKVTHDVEAAVRAAGQRLQADLAAKAEAKTQRDPIDVLEEKVMTATAVVAAATGTPEQAREMLAKARAKAMQAAADGADTGALEAMVQQMERLAKVAEERRDAKPHGREGSGTQEDTGAAVIPALTAMTARRF